MLNERERLEKSEERYRQRPESQYYIECLARKLRAQNLLLSVDKIDAEWFFKRKEFQAGLMLFWGSNVENAMELAIQSALQAAVDWLSRIERTIDKIVAKENPVDRDLTREILTKIYYDYELLGEEEESLLRIARGWSTIYDLSDWMNVLCANEWMKDLIYSPGLMKAAARKHLVNVNMRLVLWQTWKYRGKVPLIDLLHEGSLILLKAIDQFDFNRAQRFSTFATKCLENGFVDFMKQESNRSIFTHSSVVSLDQEVSGRNGAVLGDFVRDPEQGMEEKLANQEIKEQFNVIRQRSLGVLKDKRFAHERSFLKKQAKENPEQADIEGMIYALPRPKSFVAYQYFFQDCSVEKISEKYGVSEDQVRECLIDSCLDLWEYLPMPAYYESQAFRNKFLLFDALNVQCIEEKYRAVCLSLAPEINIQMQLFFGFNGLLGDYNFNLKKIASIMNNRKRQTKDKKEAIDAACVRNCIKEVLLEMKVV